MLQELHIENIALIRRADISFTEGLNVLTGETGAGKSIIIDSIEAVLGARTSRDLVRTGAEKAVVTGVFSADNAVNWCEENDIDLEDGELVVTRKIGSDGKSSCRVNGIPVSASQLRELGAGLLDIHGQNDGLKLLDERSHREYLDAFGDLMGELESYREVYDGYKRLQSEKQRLSMDEAEKERVTERLTARIQELERADIHPGEEDELISRSSLLKNAVKLTGGAESAYDALYSADDSAVSRAGEAIYELDRLAGLSDDMGKTAELIRQAQFQLTDAAEQLRDFLDALDFSPEEFDRIESRITLIRRMEKRYNRDEAGLIELLEDSREKLSELEYAGDRLIKLEKELAEARADTIKAACKLSDKRRDCADRLEKRIESELRQLSMPSVRFKTELTQTDEPDKYGMDEVRFLMSANAGEELGRIKSIASGGELSRIMLAMKTVFAASDSVPAMVFDEIDTGVSGVAAQRVGEKLSNLARGRQVLCVTHLPQIAAMADNHLHIEKTESEERTFTTVTTLDRDGRKMEIARLWGGDNITPTALAGAEEQLCAADRFKNK